MYEMKSIHNKYVMKNISCVKDVHWLYCIFDIVFILNYNLFFYTILLIWFKKTNNTTKILFISLLKHLYLSAEILSLFVYK